MKAEGCPYLVQFYGAYLDRGKVHIGLEYMDLGSLDKLERCVIAQDQQVPLEQLACIARQMVYGLHYLHSEGQLHRDISMGNVLHNSRGQVKLTDFGISTPTCEASGLKPQRGAGRPS